MRGESARLGAGRVGHVLLSGDIHDGATITVDTDDDELAVAWHNPEAHAPEEREPVGAAV